MEVLHGSSGGLEKSHATAVAQIPFTIESAVMTDNHFDSDEKEEIVVFRTDKPKVKKAEKNIDHVPLLGLVILLETKITNLSNKEKRNEIVDYLRSVHDVLWTGRRPNEAR